jgi:hypothetical protein
MLVGKLQERYGIARDEAQRRADEWMASYDESDTYSETGAGRRKF